MATAHFAPSVTLAHSPALASPSADIFSPEQLYELKARIERRLGSQDAADVLHDVYVGGAGRCRKRRRKKR